MALIVGAVIVEATTDQKFAEEITESLDILIHLLRKLFLSINV